MFFAHLLLLFTTTESLDSLGVHNIRTYILYKAKMGKESKADIQV